VGYSTILMKQWARAMRLDTESSKKDQHGRTKQCTRADGKGVLQSYKNKFHVPLTSPTSLEMLKHPHYAHRENPRDTGDFAEEEEQLGSVKTRNGDASKGLHPPGQFPASSTSLALGLR
jgi:hypothetical protein